MNADREHAYLDSVTGFVLGTLDAAEEKRLLDHLAAGCAICEEALAKLERTRTGLAASAPPRQPSPALKQKVLAAAREQAQDDPARPASEPRAGGPGTGREPQVSPSAKVVPVWTRHVAWAVAAVLAIAVGFLGLETRRERERRAQVEQNVTGMEETVRQQNLTHQADLDARDEYLDLLLDPQAVCIDFDATPEAPTNLRGKATWDPTTRRAVIALNNAALPITQDYELWAIRDGTPVSLGVISQVGDGTATVYVADVGGPDDPAAFAVSLEPAGGSPQPTPSGPVVLSASLGD